MSAKEKRYGNQTPTQSVILPHAESRAQEAIEIYHKTKHESYPWQTDLLNDIMAIDDDGLWTHQKFGYSLPRRNGKTGNKAIADHGTEKV